MEGIAFFFLLILIGGVLGNVLDYLGERPQKQKEVDGRKMEEEAFVRKFCGR